ncbi:hypothetical protein BJ742DRAFT_251426 [Cladochytrium replicatum]|nr:hypothetical protein BJ742DRAFT_251426 [Cladochytrium replicatum]
MMGKLGGKATDTWACSNDNIMHDVFISYRQEQQQQQIVLTLSRALEQHYGVVSPIHTFVDVKCLRVGEDWSAGFMKGLANSRMVLLMCSEVALEKVLESDKKPDNMFLEWEMALSRATAKSPVVVPVFLGKLGEDKTITPFRNFSVERFPDTVPCHSKSLKNRTVREIMADVYRLQGIRASDIEYIER